MSRLDFSGLVPPPDAIAARVIEDSPTPWGPLRLGVDGLGCRHVLVPVPSAQALKVDRRSAGVQIGPRPLEEDGQVVAFLDISCLKPALFDLFEVIVGEMLDALRREARDPDRVCIRVLDRWRSLLGSDNSQSASQEKLEGLFGELLHLRELARLGTHALRTWVGPDGATQDFRAPGVALEVKTTLKRAGWTVGITSIDQLNPPASTALYLSVWKLELDAADGRSVPDLIDDIRGLGLDGAELYERLKRAGLAPGAMEAARQTKFRIVDHRLWLVDSEFPKIVPKSFLGGALPRGVATIAYTLDLTATSTSHLDPEGVGMVHLQLMELAR